LYTPLPPTELHASPISFFSITSPALYWVSCKNHGANDYEVLLHTPSTSSLYS
jgi:hypothetical protein